MLAAQKKQEAEKAKQAEQARVAAEAEQARVAAEEAEQERLAAEKAGQESLAAEKAEQERLAAEQAKQERQQREAEQERLAAEQEAMLKAQKEKLNELKTQAENANTNINDNSSFDDIQSALDTVNQLSNESKQFSNNEDLNKIKDKIDGVKDQLQNKLNEKMDALKLLQENERRMIELSNKINNAKNLTDLTKLEEDSVELDLKKEYDKRAEEITSDSINLLQEITNLSNRLKDPNFSHSDFEAIESKFNDINNNPLSKDGTVSKDFLKLSELVMNFQEQLDIIEQVDGLINDLTTPDTDNLAEKYEIQKVSINELIETINNPSINKKLTQKLKIIEKINDLNFVDLNVNRNFDEIVNYIKDLLDDDNNKSLINRKLLEKMKKMVDTIDTGDKSQFEKMENMIKNQETIESQFQTLGNSEEISKIFNEKKKVMELNILYQKIEEDMNSEDFIVEKSRDRSDHKTHLITYIKGLKEKFATSSGMDHGQVTLVAKQNHENQKNTTKEIKGYIEKAYEIKKKLDEYSKIYETLDEVTKKGLNTQYNFYKKINKENNDIIDKLIDIYTSASYEWIVKTANLQIKGDKSFASVTAKNNFIDYMDFFLEIAHTTLQKDKIETMGSLKTSVENEVVISGGSRRKQTKKKKK